jgi:hypothetical protein
MDIAVPKPPSPAPTMMTCEKEVQLHAKSCLKEFESLGTYLKFLTHFEVSPVIEYTGLCPGARQAL